MAVRLRPVGARGCGCGPGRAQAEDVPWRYIFTDFYRIHYDYDGIAFSFSAKNRESINSHKNKNKNTSLERYAKLSKVLLSANTMSEQG
eukprot:scaffold109801_cov32-Tisochrysis_lutea.AAC.1